VGHLTIQLCKSPPIPTSARPGVGGA